MRVIRAEHMTAAYNKKTVVQDVSFEVNEGEILGIVGESGSGKTTVIRAVLGILGSSGEITDGNIWYLNQNLTEMSEKQLKRIRGAEIGMVFQNSQASFCPLRKIGVQLYEAVRAHEKISRIETRERAFEIMKKIGLTDPMRIWNSYPSELSGGMNQRVGICAAMLLQPRVLLADEPTSALDMDSQLKVAEEILKMSREYHTAVILVTHNIGLAKKICNRLLVLQNGSVCEYGKTKEVTENPKASYTKELLDAVLNLETAKSGGIMQEAL